MSDIMQDPLEAYKNWENLCDHLTERLKVEGGFLYRTKKIGVDCIAMCFVPDVDLQRYQAHLRDAYKQGFIDGGVDAHAQYQKCATGIADLPKEIVNV